MYSRVYVEITNICNKNCSFCHGTSRPRGRMTEEKFRTVCESLVGLTEYLYLHLMGEPLTHPSLVRFIEIARSLGFKVAITTNGTLLPARAEELIAAAPYKVNISLHSTEDCGREELISYLDGCMDFADKASGAGILTVLRLWNRGGRDVYNIDIESRLRERFNCEWTEGARGARIRHRLHLEYGDRFEWPDTDKADLGCGVFCHGLGDHFGILCDGTVVPCCLDADGVIALGNIMDTDINDILSSPRAVAICDGFGEKRAVEELCRRCGYARRFKI